MDTDADREGPPPADVPPWMDVDDDWEEESATRRVLGRGRLIAALAAVPWVLALILVLRSGGATPGDAGSTPVEAPAVDAIAAAGRAGSAGPGPSVTETPRVPGDAPPPVSYANRPRVTVTGADAVALATAIARAWITGVGPTLTVDGVDVVGPTYAEHLVAEAIDHPAPGLAVVTLLAVVLDTEDGAYRGAAVRRLAVPVALDAEGAHPAGAPWWLPAPDLAPATVQRSPLDDPELAIEASLAAETAGYADVELLELQATDSWPLIATLRAIAPGQTEAAEHEVWLRPHLGGLVVAGWLPERSDPAEERP